MLYRRLCESCFKKILLMMTTVIKSHKSHISSVLQEAMKRILKQKSHTHEVYNKSYKAIYSLLGHKVIFCIFKPNSIRKPLKQSQNIR